MSKTQMHSFELGRAKSSRPPIDKCAIVPISACAFATVIGPLLDYAFVTPNLSAAAIQNAEPGVWNRIFWPAMVTVSVVLAAQNRSRLAKLTCPFHIICLLAYAALAGASVLWAFQPASSFTRYAQQLMVLTSIVLPALLASPTVDLMRGMFLCFALGAILNIFVVVLGTPRFVENGYSGYFLGKNYLGEFAAPALLLALHEALYPGFRRAFGMVAAINSVLLLFWSNSKTALGLAFVCPLLTGLTLIIRKITHISPAIVPLSILFGYAILSSASNFNTERMSYILYGDSTFTGRTIIWEFVQHEIERRPLLGWGYQSFWLVPNSPRVEAPGFVKTMPEGHNGYYDTKLELGYVGFTLLLMFIISTLHAIGRLADRDPRRASLVLSLALFVIIYNFLESLWMRGFEFLWVVFLIVAAELARYWQPFPLTRAAHRPRSPGLGSSGPPRGARMPQPRITLS